MVLQIVHFAARYYVETRELLKTENTWFVFLRRRPHTRKDNFISVSTLGWFFISFCDLDVLDGVRRRNSYERSGIDKHFIDVL